ncbi:MAG: DHH family phosphoesterase [Halobacteriales archaeon]|nr:DHH family phosphoesterase [Halobacteriales archaeon]
MTYVASPSLATEILRRDIAARMFYLVDLGLTPRLARTIRQKGKTRQRVLCIDHHQQTARYGGHLGPDADMVVREGMSAASVAHDVWGLDERTAHLAAVADHVEYCDSEHLRRTVERVGLARVELEARILDFAWRCQLDDDRFRLLAARGMGQGLWPSEIDEVRRRYQRVLGENRWARATDRVRGMVDVRDGVAVLHFGKRKPSLFGFGTRALTAVAMERGCKLALMVNQRSRMSSVAMRAIGPAAVNLGQLAEEFTEEFGVVGGGHPSSAGARILTRDLGVFLDRVSCAAA